MTERETVAQRSYREQCSKDARTAMIGLVCLLLALIGIAWVAVAYVNGSP